MVIRILFLETIIINVVVSFEVFLEDGIYSHIVETLVRIAGASQNCILIQIV